MDPQTAPNEEVVAAEEDDAGTGFSYELGEPRWSVLTFEECAAQNLTYDEAIQIMDRLKQESVSGLCIVTDEAAARLGNA